MFFIAIISTFLLWSNAQNNAMQMAKTYFDVASDTTVYEISDRMHTYENTLKSAVAFINTNEQLNQKTWNMYITSMELNKHYPGFQGIGISKVIQPKMLSKHIAQTRADGFPDYTIKPAGKRDEYHSIIYLEPLHASNRKAIGYDMFTNPIRQQAMIHARDTGQTTLSGKVTLIQEQAPGIQAGFLMYVPFYMAHDTSLTQQQRRASLDGFVYAPFRANDLMNEVLLNKNPHILIKLYDGTSINDETLLYESKHIINKNPLFSATIPIVMYGRTWTAVFQTLPSFNTTINNDQAKLILLAGVPISFLLLLLILSFSKTAEQAQILAYKMSAEIRTLNDELENMINIAPNPIIIYTEDGNIIKINKTWIDICGYTHDETPTIDSWINKVYDQEHRDEIKAHIRNLFIITQKVDEGEFSFYNKSGTKLTWQFSSAPFGIVNGKKTLISSGMDVTELKNKDNMLMMQSRHVAMGEMINMIAHQWRQPLATISTISGTLSMEAMLDLYDQNHFMEKLNLISDLSIDLSDTINDFRNFFKEDKILSLSTWQELVEGCLYIIKPMLLINNIKVNITYDEDQPFMSYSREIKQVILNILKNAEDVLSKKGILQPQIWIRTSHHNKKTCLEIEDNAGGVPDEIIFKIFDPYFSTKLEKDGTGIGLYMSKIMVEQHNKGKLSIHNTLNGACFRIIL